MSLIFDTVAQIHYKVHFWIALINTFRMIYKLFGFAEDRILQLFLVERSISYQPCKLQLSRMSGTNFTEGGGNIPPPQCCTGEKNPVLLGLMFCLVARNRL